MTRVRYEISDGEEACMIGLISLIWQQRSTFGIVHYLNTNLPSSSFLYGTQFLKPLLYTQFRAAAWLGDWG